MSENNFLKKLKGTAKSLWSKLDDPAPTTADVASGKYKVKDDHPIANSAAVKSVRSTLEPVTSKAGELWHRLDDPTPSAADIASGKYEVKDAHPVLTKAGEQWDKLFEPKETTSPPASSPKPVELPKPKTVVKKMGIYPSRKEGHPIQYAYKYQFTAADGVNVITDVLADAEKEVSVSAENEHIILSYNGTVFGYIDNPDKALMVSDWERKGFPCSAIILATGNEVNLRFYKDKRIGLDYREQTVCKLTSCKSGSKQDTISCMEIGDEVELEEDYDRDDAVIAYYTGDPIGKLPKKQAVKFLEEGAYAAFLEKLEEDDDCNEIPYIRIYW